MILFNMPSVVGGEADNIADVSKIHKISGDGKYTKLCSEWLEKKTGKTRALLTTSCTHATEMVAFLTDTQSGDEVIMSSYIFVSTADTFVLRGTTAVFADICPIR